MAEAGPTQAPEHVRYPDGRSHGPAADRTAAVAAWLAGAGIVVAALALRLHRLGAQEFWLDEAFSFNEITAPDWLNVVRLSEPPLYPVLLHAWSAVAGTGEAALRLPSAVFGTAFVLAVMWTAHALFDRTVALWSGLVAATSPIQIYYSQEARAYALLTLVLIGTHALVAAALRTNGWGRWALVAVALAAGPYTHYLAPLALAPTAVVVLLARKPARFRRYLVAVAAAVVLYAPWVVWSFVATDHSFAGLDWIRRAWEDTPPRSAFPKSLEVLYLGPHRGYLPIVLKQYESLDVPAAARVVGLAALAVLGVWTAGPWGARRADDPRTGAPMASVWVLFLGPLALLATISLVRPVYLVGRYDQLALPAFPLLVGVGLAKLGSLPRRGRLLSTVAAVALLVPVAVVLVRYYEDTPPTAPDHRGTAAALNAAVRDGDLVVFTHPRCYPLRYQLAQLGDRVSAATCERASDGVRFACRDYPRHGGSMVMTEDIERVAGHADVVADDLDTVYLPALAAPDRDVFVLFGTYETGPAGFMVPERDRLLLQGLFTRGFETGAIDPLHGVARLHRRIPQP